MIPGDQLPTQTEQKEACGAQDLVVLASVLPTLGDRQASAADKNRRRSGVQTGKLLIYNATL